MLWGKAVIDCKSNKQINVIFYSHNSDAIMRKDVLTPKRSFFLGCGRTNKLIINPAEGKTYGLSP